MPLTRKGKKIKRAITTFYGKLKGTRVFYAGENKGIFGEGVKRKPRKRKSR
jgi:hypothetical protein